MRRDLSCDIVRPDPLSSSECDLRGLEWMPLNASNLLDSDLFLLSTGDEFKAAMALICKSWRQVPAGSLPSDENALATLAGARDWTMVRTMALRNWVLCSDGRYYHPIVSAKAMEALPHREEFVAKKTAEAERKVREREDRRRLFQALREAGIVLPFDTKTTTLREQFKKLQPVDNPPGEPVVTPLVTPPVRDNQSRDNRDTSRLGHDTTPHDTTVVLTQGIGTTESPPAGGDDAPTGDGGTPFELTDETPQEEPVPTPGAPALPTCPHLKVLAVWLEVLPELPQHDPDEWRGPRRDNLQARWREKASKLKWVDQEQGLTYFRRLFGYVRKSKFLMGHAAQRDPNRRPFQLELQWLLRPTNWANVLEGKYHSED